MARLAGAAAGGTGRAAGRHAAAPAAAGGPHGWLGAGAGEHTGRGGRHCPARPLPSPAPERMGGAGRRAR
ncbi:hypothetical protein F2P46_09050 [Massilia sp. CCM 8734]|nr:hypothetical protein [Massilia sp. CCM 8734]